jgi:hypothetical protein
LTAKNEAPTPARSPAPHGARARPGWLDLDDVRAHVGEQHAGEGTRHHLGLIDYANPVERARHGEA